MIGYMTIQSFVMMCDSGEHVVRLTLLACIELKSSSSLWTVQSLLGPTVLSVLIHILFLGPGMMRVALDCKYNSPSQKFLRIFLRVVYHKGKTSYLVVLLLLFHSIIVSIVL